MSWLDSVLTSLILSFKVALLCYGCGWRSLFPLVATTTASSRPPTTSPWTSRPLPARSRLPGAVSSSGAALTLNWGLTFAGIWPWTVNWVATFWWGRNYRACGSCKISHIARVSCIVIPALIVAGATPVTTVTTTTSALTPGRSWPAVLATSFPTNQNDSLSAGSLREALFAVIARSICWRTITTAPVPTIAVSSIGTSCFLNNQNINCWHKPFYISWSYLDEIMDEYKSWNEIFI